METLEGSNLIVFTFKAKHPTEIQSNLVSFEIKSKTDQTKILFANTINHITTNINCPNQIESLKDLNVQNKIIADDNSLGGQVDILVGNDYFFSLINEHKVEIKSNLYLVDTFFGWMWSGQCNQQQTQETLSIMTYVNATNHIEREFTKPDLPLERYDAKQFWDLEVIGITDSPSLSRDEEAVKMFQNSISYIDNRYYVKWP